MRVAASVVIGFVLATFAGLRAAHAYEEKFHGWAPDGTWYVDSWAGTDEMDRYRLCVTDGGAVPASWPAKMPRPEQGERCAALCDEINAECMVDLKQIEKWVVDGQEKSPAGEKVTVRFTKTTIVVTVAGKAGLAEAELELLNGGHPGETRIQWAPNGAAVAVSLFDFRDPRQEDGFGPPSYVAVIAISPRAREVRQVIDAAAREVRIQVAHGGAAAWASYELKGKRVTDVLAVVDGKWKVVTSFASVGTKDAAAHAAAAAGKLPALPPAPGEDAPAALVTAFTCDLKACDDASVRDDMTTIGSAPGERSRGAAAWTRAWQAWAGRARLVGAPRGGLAPGGGVGWVVADVAVSYTRDARSYEIPFRVFVVYEHEGDAWTTAAAQVSIVKPTARPATR